MNLIIKIAWRNILRHRGKSIIIGVILFLGAFVMTIGNGVISGMDRGLQKNIVEGFTGDLIIAATTQESDNVFLEFMGKAIDPIYNYPSIDSMLKTILIVKSWLPIGKNTAMVLNEDGGMPDFVFVLGVDFAKYKAFFGENLKVIEGTFPMSNGPAVLVPTGWRKQFFNFSNIWFTCPTCSLDTALLPPDSKTTLDDIAIKHSVVYMGMNSDNSTTDVRTEVAGVVKYQALNTIFGNFPILDIESYRSCLGYLRADDASVVLSEAEKHLLALDDPTALFGAEPPKASSDAPVAKTLAIASPVKPVDINTGVYNLVLVKLIPGQNLDASVKKITESGKKIGVRAVSWKKATGLVGSIAVVIKAALFLFVMFLFFVAIIIIVNTLSMAALERTSEIGMMRAVGAKKSFIGRMFFAETGMLSFVFGGIGIVSGFIAIQIVSLLHWTTDNDMLQLLYGGDTFRPFLSLGDIGITILQLALVTLIAVLYPLSVARRITPLDAISRD